MGVRPPKATDRRVQRTRRTLRDALVALILERGWDEVSVQDVCDRADVGRSTFYTHFADKEELLLSGFDEFRKVLRSRHAAAAESGRPLGFARDLIDHAHDNLRLFRALLGKRSGLLVQRRFRELVLELVAEDLAGLAPAGPVLDGTVHYVGGAFVELLTWWLDSRGPLPPAEVEALFQRLTTPVLAAARRGRS